MNNKDRDKLAIQALQGLAGMVSFNLSLEPMLTTILGKVTDATWTRIFQSSPRWFDHYFTPPQELLVRLLQTEPAREVLVFSEENTNLFERFNTIHKEVTGSFKEIVAITDQLVANPNQADFDLENQEDKKALEGLVLVKALLAEIRARAFYGQGMLSFITAGKNGKDEGYYRAASIDPAIQCHPSITERISRDALVGKTEFKDNMQRAGTKGPSKNIDVDLHQLRFMLSLLRDFGLLDQMSNEARYKTFFEQLQLYPDTGSKEGKNVKAALCLFIDRWESSLVA